MKHWKTTEELIVEVQETYENLKNGTLDVGNARAMALLFKQATKLVELRLEFARMTDSLVPGMSELPDIVLTSSEEPRVRIRRKA